MSDEPPTGHPLLKPKYLIAIGVFSLCVVWRLILTDPNGGFPPQSLPTCVAIVVGLITVIMVGTDPEIQLFDDTGRLNKEIAARMNEVAANKSAQVRRLVVDGLQGTANCVNRISAWIEKRDQSASSSAWRRLAAILAFWLGAAGITVPLVWYTLDDISSYRLAWGAVAAVCVLCLDLVFGGSGWGPQPSRGFRGILQLKQYWPSITRNARTFTRGFIGGMATTILYGLTLAALLVLGKGLNGNTDGPPGTHPRGGNNDRYESELMLKSMASVRIADASAKYWNTVILEQMPNRFPEPADDASVQEFSSVMIQGLERAIQRTKVADRQSVAPRLLALSDQLVEVDQRLIELFREAERIGMERGQPGASANADESILQGIELADALANGTITTTQIAESWGLPNELVERMFSLDERRARQWDEIVEMRSFLQATYPFQRFDLPEVPN